MNKFIGVGSLQKNAMLAGGEKKVLRFTLVTLSGHNSKTQKDYWAFVPCVVFSPSAENVKLLTENAHGLLIGLEGRVNTSKFESKGQTKYSTEVIVDGGSIRVLRAVVGETATAPRLET